MGTWLAIIINTWNFSQLEEMRDIVEDTADHHYTTGDFRPSEDSFLTKLLDYCTLGYSRGGGRIGEGLP